MRARDHKSMRGQAERVSGPVLVPVLISLCLLASACGGPAGPTPDTTGSQAPTVELATAEPSAIVETDTQAPPTPEPATPVPPTLPPATPVQVPTEVVVAPEAGWQVQRYQLYDEVYATINDISKLENLTDNTPKPLLPDGLVKTSTAGEGRLTRDQCEAYVFQESTLFFGSDMVVRVCPREETGISCSAQATAWFQNCNIRVETPSATLATIGTRWSLTYKADTQLTLVTVQQGTVIMTPKISTAVPAAPLRLTAGQAAFTYPLDQEANVSPLLRALGPRTVKQLPEIAPRIETIGMVPQFQRMNLELLKVQAEPVPLAQPFSIALQGESADLNDARIQEGFAQALNPAQILAGTDFAKSGSLVLKFAQPQVAPVTGIARPAIDLSARPALALLPTDTPAPLAFAPRRLALGSAALNTVSAKRLLAEANYPSQKPTSILYDADNPELARLAAGVVANLKAAGIQAEPVPVGSDAMATELKTRQQEGPALVLAGS